MPIALDEGKTRCVIRLEGGIDITCSDELKRILVEAFSSRKELQVDLARATDFDVTAIQTLWAASRAAESLGVCFEASGPIPEDLLRAVHDAGFEKFPVPTAPRAGQEIATDEVQVAAHDR